MDRETYQRGLEVRSAVLGEAYVNKALADADDFTGPLQDLLTEYCWGAVWGRDELPRKTRSMLNLAMISVLNRPNELRTAHQGGTDQRRHPRGDPRDLPAGRHLRGRPGRGRQLPHRRRGVRRAGRDARPASVRRAIGFIGLGNMGFPMARRLIEGDHHSSRSTRAAEAVDRVVALGARAASSSEEVADRAETVLASLPTPDGSLEVATGAGGVIEGSRVKRYVDLSTVGSRAAVHIHDLLAERGIVAIDSPVSGGVGGAEKGTLAVMVSGPARRIRRHPNRTRGDRAAVLRRRAAGLAHRR